MQGVMEEKVQREEVRRGKSYRVTGGEGQAVLLW